MDFSYTHWTRRSVEKIYDIMQKILFVLQTKSEAESNKNRARQQEC